MAADKYLEDFRSSLLQTGSKVAKHCRALPLAAGSFSVEAQRLLLITILRALEEVFRTQHKRGERIRLVILLIVECLVTQTKTHQRKDSAGKAVQFVFGPLLRGANC